MNGNGGKPKGMRWPTFERLTAEHESFAGLAPDEMKRRFGIVP
jgi:hypothetical protein